MLNNIKQAVISATDEATWESMRFDLMPELVVYLIDGDIQPLIEKIEENIDSFAIDEVTLNSLESTPPTVELPVEARANINTSNTFMFSGRCFTRKDKWCTFHRSYGPAYHQINQRLNSVDSDPTYDADIENGFVLLKGYTSLDVSLIEKRWSTKLEDITYRFDVIRNEQILHVGEILTDSTSPYRKNKLFNQVFNFNFEPLDMIVITAKSTGSNSYTFINTTLKFE